MPIETTGPTPGQPLTDEEIEAIGRECFGGASPSPLIIRSVGRIIAAREADAYQQGRTDLAAASDATWALRTPSIWESPDARSVPTLLAAIGQVLAADSTPRPVLDVAPCGCHFPKIAGCDHDEPADSAPSEDQP